MQVKPTEIAFPFPIHQQMEGESSRFPGAVDLRQHVQFSAMFRVDKPQVRHVPPSFQGCHLLVLLLLAVVLRQKGLGSSAVRRKATGLLKAMHEHMAKCFDIVTGRKGEL